MKLYLQTVKTNIMLVFAAMALLIVTAGIWLGLPVIGLPALFDGVKLPIAVYVSTVSISAGVLFSLYFLPLHISFARAAAAERKKGTAAVLLKTQTVFAGVSACIFAAVYAGILLDAA